MELYELPIKSIRELVANAVIHRSYLVESKIQISVFDDRIEVLSPGMLYGGMDIATMKTGRSKCRNQAIADMFQYMHIVEAWGTGISRIIKSCKQYGLQEPVFEELVMESKLLFIDYKRQKQATSGKNKRKRQNY